MTTTLRSFLSEKWVAGTGGLTPLHNPATEEVVAEAGTGGVDFRAALEHARTVGGPALRALTFAARAKILKELSRALHGKRDELIALAVQNGGNTRGDA